MKDDRPASLIDAAIGVAVFASGALVMGRHDVAVALGVLALLLAIVWLAGRMGR